MGQEEVTITISPDGHNVDVDAKGFTGSKCTDFMKKTMDALGSIESEGKKDEYYSHGSGGIHTGA